MKFSESIAVMVGTIIGAGVFVLPYTALQSGYIITLSWLFILAIIAIFLHLFFGEIVLRTKADYRLPGYVGHYLGKPAQRFLLITTFVSCFFHLLIYLLLGTRFLNIILQPFNITEGILILSLWFILSIIILWNNYAAGKINFPLSLCLVFLFVFIFLVSLPQIQSINLFAKAENITFHWLLPYGTIFFALNGLVSIPEAIKIAKHRKISLKFVSKIIIIGTFIPAFLYALFITGVLGVSGANTSEEAIYGLIPYLGSSIIFIGALLGFLSVTTSYLIFGSYLKNSFLQDFRWPKLFSCFLIALIPLLLYFLNLEQIIILISLSGALLGGFEGIMMLFTLRKAKEQGDREPEYKIPLPFFVFIGLVLCFIVGALAQVFIIF